MTKQQNRLVDGAHEIAFWWTNVATPDQRDERLSSIVAYRGNLTHIVAQSGRNADAAAEALTITQEIQ